MDKSFGEFSREKRLNNNLTLRNFCNRFGFDTAYISRLENNKIPAPKNREKISLLAKSLNIKKGTKDWSKFFDLAYQSRKELSPEIKENASEIINILPAFLRKPDGKKIKKDNIKKLIGFLVEGKSIDINNED